MSNSERKIIIVDDGIIEAKIEEERKLLGDSVETMKKIGDFSGNKATHVTLLSADPAKLIESSEDLIKILENILAPEGKFVLKSEKITESELGQKLTQTLKFSGYVSVSASGDVISAEKDKFEVNFSF